MLSIGGGNLQFYPNFALILTLGGINLNHNFFQVSKLSEDKKKTPEIEQFFPPNLSEDQKKRSSPKIEEFFSRNHVKNKKNVHTYPALRCRPESNY